VIAPHSNPLLDAWHETARQRADDVALVDAGSGQRWTFEALRAAGVAAAHGGTDGAGVVSPQGHGMDFIIAVLSAWEAGRLVCPLDTAAAAPGPEAWSGLREAFPEAVLAKTTSGSTGLPRHVLFSAEQLTADARAIVRTMGLHPGRPHVGAISLAHSYGFSNLVLPLLLHGIPLVLAASPLPESVRAALKAVPAAAGPEATAALPGVPAMWRAWHAAGVLSTGVIDVALSAGAPLPLELEHRIWNDTGLKLHNFLGSSECGGIAYDRTSAPRPHGTLAGTPLDTVTLTRDAAGLLVVHSPAVGLAYWPPESDRDGAAGPALQPGVFRTGDLAEEQPDGWHLLGRAADTVNLAGRKLHPIEIEHLLRAHPAVKECLVFGIPSPDPARGEEIVAAVALEDDATSLWNELPPWLGAQLPSWKRPRHWWPCPELAATSRGKLPRAAWRERFLEDPGPR
jgi:long-chain acyl-CoA synthetase